MVLFTKVFGISVNIYCFSAHSKMHIAILKHLCLRRNVAHISQNSMSAMTLEWLVGTHPNSELFCVLLDTKSKDQRSIARISDCMTPSLLYVKGEWTKE